MRNRCLYIGAALLSVYMIFQACQSEQEIRKAQYTVNGKRVYTNHCENCHGAKGGGLGALYPPLTDRTVFTTNREQLACIVRYGKADMPANATLSPIEIAYVLTYIGNSFGNSTDMFTQEEIQAGLTGCWDGDTPEE